MKYIACLNHVKNHGTSMETSMDMDRTGDPPRLGGRLLGLAQRSSALASMVTNGWCFFSPQQIDVELLMYSNV